MENKMRCGICGKSMPLNLYIIHTNICTGCEERIVKTKIGQNQYDQIKQAIGKMFVDARMTLH